MIPELEEQQRLAHDLKERLQSMEEEEKKLHEKMRLLEAKLTVQDLRNKIRVKSDVINQLRSKVQELEGKLKSENAVPTEEQIQVNQPQEEKPAQPRQFF